MQTSQHWRAELEEAQALQELQRHGDCVAKLRTLLRRCGDDFLCRALTLDALGRALLSLGQTAEAVPALEESLALMRETAGEDAPLTVGVMQHLAQTWLEWGDLRKSAALCREAVRRCERAFGPTSLRLAQALMQLSAVCYRQKLLDEARMCLQRAMAIWEAQRPLPPELALCCNNLGRILEEQGRIAEGIAQHRRAVALRRDLLGDRHADTAFSLGNLGVALASGGQWDEAAHTLEAAVACYARMGMYDCADVRCLKENLVLCRRALGQNGAPRMHGETAAHGARPKAPAVSAPPSSTEADAREELLREIIERELAMFLATPNDGGVAACQERPDSFRIMRRMAHEGLGDATLASYVEDLRRAARQGRNFMVEKYARMDNLLPPLSESPLLDEIVDAEAAFSREAAARYPRIIRPGGQERFRAYLRCELETLSPATLERYAADMRRARLEGRNPAIDRYECLARLLGRGSLAVMEGSAHA